MVSPPPFVDVQVEGVPLATAFPVSSSAGEGLLLKNTDDSALEVHVEVLQPTTGDLRGGALPIPDVHWIKIVPDRFELPAHGEATCHVTLFIPGHRAYRRKYYQAMIWSHTEPMDGQGVGLSAGLISRLRFKTK